MKTTHAQYLKNQLHTAEIKLKELNIKKRIATAEFMLEEKILCEQISSIERQLENGEGES